MHLWLEPQRLVVYELIVQVHKVKVVLEAVLLQKTAPIDAGGVRLLWQVNVDVCLLWQVNVEVCLLRQCCCRRLRQLMQEACAYYGR